MCPIDILTGEIAVEVTGVVGASPALWYFRYIVSIFLTTQAPVPDQDRLIFSVKTDYYVEIHEKIMIEGLINH